MTPLRWLCLASIFLIVSTLPVAGQQPFFPGGTYDGSVPTPESFLGHPLAESPARVAEVFGYAKILAEKSGRIRILEMGKTYEGRVIFYVVVSSPENIARLDRIKANNARLADPRGLTEDAAHALAAEQPLIVWAEYAIHGDEISSVDAALQVLYQLAAGTDATTLGILKELVVCIDPMVNPDGRERFLGQMEQWNGAVPNPDFQSFHHTGTWPGGRGNHYLFDMNRDWFILAHPEMQARVRAIVGWNPHLMIDSHEMGSTDTYLFHPPREPLNHNISPVPSKWWKTFAADQAKAFDRYGWSYYTREWNDDWYPGYGSSWVLYMSAIGILYEQAGVDGSLVRRPDGSFLTYRETVHHHFISTMANLATAARNRQQILEDFTADRRKVAGDPHAETFYVVPGANATRLARLVERLSIAGIEVRRLEREAMVRGVQDVRGAMRGAVKFPAGTVLISCAQPLGRYVRAILEFDPRMKTSFLDEERKSLEKESDSKLYDNTAWSMLLAANLDAYVSAESPPAAPLIGAQIQPRGVVEQPQAAYGFLMDYADDRAVEALAFLLQRGCQARSAKEPLTIAGRSYGRGTLLFRRNENPDTLGAVLQAAAAATGVTIVGVSTALSTAGPDLGGNDMVLLRVPRPAIVAGPGFDGTSFGATWYLLDQKLRMRASILDVQQVASGDLRKYNILVLPSANPQSLARVFGKPDLARVREWMEQGGTLIAIGGSAAFAADTANSLSGVRLRSQVLKDTDLYGKAADLESKADAPNVDSIALWGGKVVPPDTGRGSRGSPVDEKLLSAQEERARLFAPRGSILQAQLDDEFWMSFGEGKSVPVLMSGSAVFLSRSPVRTPARLGTVTTLRLSGLLWPEARERFARSAYATREARGRGQLILFAGQPNYRASFEGAERLLINALLLGPGCGTVQPIEW
jgi:hypothetical protein